MKTLVRRLRFLRVDGRGRSARVLLIDAHGRVLLQKAASGHWYTPGGRLDAEESLTAGAVRETRVARAAGRPRHGCRRGRHVVTAPKPAPVRRPRPKRAVRGAPGRAPRMVLEAELHGAGWLALAAADEVGRGALSGPVTVGLVI